MRQAFADGFEHLFQQLQTFDTDLTQAQINQVELYLSNCLAYLPFADITPYESFAIPQFINNQWQLIDYKVIPIELTPTTGIEKCFLTDNDRVFAYALEPISNQTAQPHLIFMGTTYPAGQGHSIMVHTDMEAFATPGNQLYRSGRANILHWLEQQDKRVRVSGMSLGGALAMQLALDQPKRLSHVFPLNPAGLCEPVLLGNDLDHWQACPEEERPLVVVQSQAMDPVSFFGEYKNNFILYKVTPPPGKGGPNVLAQHALNNAGFKDTRFELLDTVALNDERKMPAIPA